MPSESSSALPPLPSNKKPRPGQAAVWRVVEEGQRQAINPQLPTGYGKGLTYCRAYAILQHQRRVDGLFIVFPNETLLTAFTKSAPQGDLLDARVAGSLDVVDVRFFGANALRYRRIGTRQIFVINAQSLIFRAGQEISQALLAHGRWMGVIDEHQHYGMERAWGRAAAALPFAFRLVCSATPYRRDGDNAFGPPDPDLVVTYCDAVKDHAVKPLQGHSYEYRLDAQLGTGEIKSYTTSELAEEAGGLDADIEAYRLKRGMRWSPKYVSPLVTRPIDRLLAERERTGYPLQMLVSAMCVSHAQIVCDQLRSWCPGVRADWIGTGDYGRSDEENKAVLERFCPSKVDGERPLPSLDVLVHFMMFGEGGDSPWISEVVHLCPTRLGNKTNQHNGRGSRYVPNVTTHVSFDSSSPYAAYTGRRLELAMDLLPPGAPTPEPPDGDPVFRDLPPLPDEPGWLKILELELTRIDDGPLDNDDPGLQRMIRATRKAHPSRYSEDDFRDPKSEAWTIVKQVYRDLKREEWEAVHEQTRVAQWRQSVDNAVSAAAGAIMRLMIRNGQRVERSLAGDVKKRINTQKRRLLGEISNDETVCRSHYGWVVQLEREVREHGIPAWLL